MEKSAREILYYFSLSFVVGSRRLSGYYNMVVILLII